MVIKKWSGSAWEKQDIDVSVGEIVASGTADSTTFLRGDGQWAEPDYITDYVEQSTTNLGKVGSVSLVTLSSASDWANLPIGKMVMVNSTSTGKPSFSTSYGYVIKGPARDMSGGGSWIWIDYLTAEIAAGKAGDSSTLPTWLRNSFQMEDGDGTEVTISAGKEMKFIEGGGIDINWTDTSTGSDGDPYDLTFKVNGVIETNDSTTTKIWVGTESEYTSIGTKDSNTLYFCTS